VLAAWLRRQSPYRTLQQLNRTIGSHLLRITSLFIVR
jgi:hypothetical protein